MSPREVAAAKLPANDVIESMTVVAGPGFINLKLKSDFLAAAVRGIATDPKLGVPPAAPPKTVRRRVQQPERGQAAARRPPPQHDHRRRPGPASCGSRATPSSRDNHLGDWGTQFGILMYGYKPPPATTRRLRRRPGARAGPAVRHVRGLFAKPAEDDEDDGSGPADDPVKKACQRGDGQTPRRRPGERRPVEAVHAALPGRGPPDLPPARHPAVRPRTRRELLQPDAARRRR